MSTQEKVTIYAGSGMFGVHKIEGKLIAHGRKKFAQYDNAPFIHFVEKGKRTPKGYCEGYKPFFLILKGHGHPNPDDPFVTNDLDGVPGMVIKKSRYASCDSRYQTDFNALIDPYLNSHPGILLADYRHTSELQS